MKKGDDNSNVVWAIPQKILEDCPLPEYMQWHDETKMFHASLYDTRMQNAFGWIRRFDSRVEVRLQCDENVPFPLHHEEDALRYIYAKYLFDGPTT